MAFDLETEIRGQAAILTLSGELDAAAAPELRERIADLAGEDITKLVLDVSDLSYMASAGLRALVFAKQKMGQAVDIYIVGAQENVSETIHMTGFHHSVIMMDDYSGELADL